MQDALEEHIDLCRMRRLRSTDSRRFDSPDEGEEDDDGMFGSSSSSATVAAMFSMSGMGDAAEFGGFGGAPVEVEGPVEQRSFNSRRRQLLGRAGLRRRHPKDVK